MSETRRAVPTVKIDNERVRVVEWRFAPGTATGWHRHEYAYVVVPLTTGPLALTGADGAVTTAELRTGEPYFRLAGVEHDVLNPNATEFVFVEIELKDAPVSARGRSAARAASASRPRPTPRRGARARRRR